MNRRRSRQESLERVERELLDASAAEVVAAHELAEAERRLSRVTELLSAGHALSKEPVLEARGAVEGAERRLAELRTERAHLIERVSRARSTAAAASAAMPILAVGDAAGHDLRPNPLRARTTTELMETLRQFRTWAGEPSYKTMAGQCGGRAGASTMNIALRKDTLPKLPLMLAIVAGCGGSEEDEKQYATAWRQIQLGPGSSSLSEVLPPQPLRAVSTAG